jgi:dihydropteroate synthase
MPSCKYRATTDMTSPTFATWLENPHREPLVMGILNVTPDSFSDGGRFADPAVAIAHAHQMVADGAALIDIGGESTRPGAARIPAEEQIRRIVPVLKGLSGLPAILSVDTTRADVATAALDGGANLINDISGGLDDPAMLPLAAERKVPIVLMHMRGQPAYMQQLVEYQDVVAEVRSHLARLRDGALAAGIHPSRIILDPGIGFAKRLVHNLTLLKHLAEINNLGHPLLLGTSRKSFMGKITGEDEPSHRLFSTAATVGWCIANGAAIVRVHDVAEMTRVVRMTRAIKDGFFEESQTT